MEKNSKSKSSAAKSQATPVKNLQPQEELETEQLLQSSKKERPTSKKNTPKQEITPKKSLEKNSQKKSVQKSPRTPKETPREEEPINEVAPFEEVLATEQIPNNNAEEIKENEIVEADAIDVADNNSDEDNLDFDIDEDDLADFEINEEEIEAAKQRKIENALKFKEAQAKKGVIYLSSIPPYMKVSQLRKLFGPYDVERIYLTPEDEGKRKFRVKTGGNKRRKYVEGWMEFKDKKVAKYVATVYNNQKIGGKRGGFYTEDVLNLRYLPKFKWENLVEKINYDTKMRKEKMRNELALAKKQHDFYLEQVEKGKKIMGIKKQKDMKRIAAKDIEEVLDDAVKQQDDSVEQNKKSSFDDEKDRIRRIFKQKKPKVSA